MLSAAVPIRHDRLEPSTIVGGNLELDPCAHAGIVAEPDVQRDSYDCISALGDGPNYAEVGVGVFDVFAFQGERATSAAANIGFRWGRKVWFIGPAIGLMG